MGYGKKNVGVQEEEAYTIMWFLFLVSMNTS